MWHIVVLSDCYQFFSFQTVARFWAIDIVAGFGQILLLWSTFIFIMEVVLDVTGWLNCRHDKLTSNTRFLWELGLPMEIERVNHA